MNKRAFLKTAAAGAVTSLFSPRLFAAPAPSVGAHRTDAEWALEIDVMESCSCRVFCQCFFTSLPLPPDAHAAHSPVAQHACLFNQAYRVTKGHYRGLSLDGAQFWYSGDAGPDLREAKWPWVVMTFDSALEQPKRDALWTMLQKLRFYRAERWTDQSVATAAPISWALTDDGAKATLGAGRGAELSLKRLKGQHAGAVVLQNLSYFGFPRNNGFALMPSVVQAYRTGNRGFEFTGTNGFVTTVQMTADDFPAPAK